jgi:POT family proton-dependent oligopeptide transporter
MQNIDPITVIIFIPICDQLVYPFLRKMGIAFKPITRIFWGFLMGSVGMSYAAYVQHLIYTAPPCYTNPLHCPAAVLPNGEFQHNKVHVGMQSPAYFFIALSEIFASITGLEYAYTKAPPSMKSLIMSLFLLTTAFGAALGAAIAPLARDPNLMGLYIGLAVASLVGGCVFWRLFSKYNRTEDVMNEMSSEGKSDGEGTAMLPMS